MGDAGGLAVHVEPLAALRRRTAPLHRAVERSVGLLAAGVTRDRYAAVLAAFARLHAGLDADLLRHAPVDLPMVARLPLLHADLTDLGCPPPDTLPGPPVPTSRASALGARYVVEGSRLGGAVLVRHLRRALGADLPVRYLTVGGADARTGWAAFRAVAERDLRTTADVDAAADAAVAVFRRLHDELVS